MATSNCNGNSNSNCKGNSNDSSSNDNVNGNHSTGANVNGNSVPEPSTSFASIEVSNGQEETATLHEDTAAERDEIRRLPTETWVDGMSRSLFRRSDDHCYHKDSSTSNNDERRNT
ncbi:hypothetical protein NLG97_g2063 [Lecanicillium saksenae]|uniref:Uncharacterized protein n=1 Tax=Lecanicillium saksenae TaxID=468837 RepID=A0ACC1R614_9HYPO|nr:hypothetical protein NLG97_g2063 [Lecanicillium saksenae]